MRRDEFQAIADPTRREIISLIAYQSLNLNSLADNSKISRPAISQHVKILSECGLVHIKKIGRERYCEARLKKLDTVADWIEPFRKMWEEKFDALDSLLVKMKAEELKKKKKK